MTDTTTAAPTPKKPVDPAQTYGQMKRDPANWETLSRAEKAELLRERAWERANPEEVAKLEALVGCAVRLRRRFRTYATDDVDKPAETRSVPEAQQRPNPPPESYIAGRRLQIFARAGKVLLGRMKDGVVLQVKREWVRLAD